MPFKNVVVSLRNVSKAFGEVQAVNNISLDVKQGEIFALIGPNGSGKTTILRMIVDILKPDVGGISVFGGKWNEDKKDLVGYLPEERGLYNDLTVSDTIGYLSSLKGIDSGQAVARADEFLSRLGQPLDNSKKIKELSHGMAQLVQLAVAIVHNPSLVIMDEPFAGLDPVKCELFKDVIRELNASGKTIIMSTHRMYEVEALCERVFMMNEGACVLYGGLQEIKERYNRGVIRVSVKGDTDELQGVISQRECSGYKELILAEGVIPEDILRQLLARGLSVQEFAIKLPALSEIFVDVLGNN